MEIAEWIDLNLKDFKDGLCTFIEACKMIATHDKLSAVTLKNNYAVFNIATSISKTNITVENPLDKSAFDAEEILKIVSEVSGIPVEAIKTKSKKREIVEARHAYFLISLYLKDKGLTNSILKDIGAIVNRDHVTVIHARKNEHLKSIQKIIYDTKIFQ
jgi:chromosomal replication initiator protein